MAILTGEIIPNNDRNRKSIQKEFPFICNNVDPLEILPTLRKHGVIDDMHMQQIRNISTQKCSIEGMVELLLVIPTMQSRWFQFFIEALIDAAFDHVARRIDSKLYEGTDFWYQPFPNKPLFLCVCPACL